MVIAYLIYTHNMSYDSAFDLVHRKRACIKPNSGFVRALQDWEKQWRLAAQQPGRAARAPPRPDLPSPCFLVTITLFLQIASSSLDVCR